MEQVAANADPVWVPETHLPEKALGFRVQQYGMTKHADLFTTRQLTALSTLAELLGDVTQDIEERAEGDVAQRRDYAVAVATYLGLGVAKLADYVSSLVSWSVSRDQAAHVFTRHALSMIWDFTEVNVFAGAAGDFVTTTAGQARAVSRLLTDGPVGTAYQAAAQHVDGEGVVFATDPPYYDNVPYADLSDYFYVWLRRGLRSIHPELFRTLLVPKAEELVAEPSRHGGRSGAERFFEEGMSSALERIAHHTFRDVPLTVYYAFKQSETRDLGTSSTGWETFLQGALNAGLTIVGTWPVATERAVRTRGLGSNALASSVVLVCRKRDEDAPTITRGRFRRALRAELPAALRALEKGNIAPVDMAQASIGPGMAIFSRHSRVLEADDSPMTVRAALQLINEVADEIRGEEEAELDRETRFAVTWFETHGFDAGPYGEAEVLATARAVSVSGVAEAGVCKAAAGKVRLIPRTGLRDDWDPVSDRHLTVWEATQHLIKRLEDKGESAAARLMSQLGPVADDARLLAYRLYTVCERRGWAEEGRAYNGLVVAWPDLERMAGSTPAPAPAAQPHLL